MTSSSSSIISALSDGVLTVTINRPGARNALRVQDKRELTQVVRDLSLDEVRCIVLTGSEDKAFCAGSDLKEMADMDATTCLVMEEVEASLHETIMRCPVPVLAAINGWALGTGCELVIVSDLSFADPGAHFGQPEILNGAPTPIQAALLPRIIGLTRARWLAYTGEAIDAQTALAWGLINEVTGPGEALARATAVARRIVERVHPTSMKLQKRIVDSWVRYPFDAAVASSMYVTSSAYNSGWPQSAATRMRERVAAERQQRQ
jgi:enoyl-CoA hydratase/carnithine racemase